MAQLEQLTKTQRFGFKHARTAAMTSLGVGRGSFRVGAVITDGREVLTAACNSRKSHPLLRGHTLFPCLHAETAAIFKCGFDNCIGNDIYVYRLWRNGKRAPAKPCMVCQKFIKIANLKRVYYTDFEGYYCIDATTL